MLLNVFLVILSTSVGFVALRARERQAAVMDVHVFSERRYGQITAPAFVAFKGKVPHVRSNLVISQAYFGWEGLLADVAGPVCL